MLTLGYPDAKISLKEDAMPMLFPVLEAMLMPPIRRTSTTTVHLGSKRAASVDTGHVGSSIFWRVRPATLVTSASEHNGHSDLCSNDCVAST